MFNFKTLGLLLLFILNCANAANWSRKHTCQQFNPSTKTLFNVTALLQTFGPTKEHFSESLNSFYYTQPYLITFYEGIETDEAMFSGMGTAIMVGYNFEFKEEDGVFEFKGNSQDKTSYRLTYKNQSGAYQFICRTL